MLGLILNIMNTALNDSSGAGVDVDSFIFEITTTESDESVTIPTNGAGYNYKATVSDGQVFENVTGDQAIVFAVAGVYKVAISVENGGYFPTIYINNNADDLNFTDVKQWGNIAWTSFSNSFNGASNLVGSFTDAPDLSSVTSMLFAFQNAQSFNGNLSGWNMSNITDLRGMFLRAFAFNSDVGSWDVSNVTRMRDTFSFAQDFNQDIGSWDVSSCTDMQGMFNGADLFDQNLSSWNIVNVINFTGFMNGVTLSTSNYDALLIGWEATLQAAFPSGTGYTPTISISFGSSQFTSGGVAETSKDSLINNFGWTITDGGSI
jgi:surface protein